MDLLFGTDLSQEQQIRVSPGLIALNQILALSSQELQEEIQRELESNPALEMDERQICPNCGTSYVGRVCQRCLADGNNVINKLNSNNQSKTSSDDYSDDYFSYGENWAGGSRSNGGGDEEFDPLTVVAAEMSLAERILIDVGSVLDDDDMPIAEFLTGSIDERGYLATPLASVAEMFSTDEEHVEKILKEIQNVAPPGVAARDFRECLLIQLRFLKEQGIEPPYVQEIIDKYFNELGEHKYTFIAQQMGITTTQIQEAREFIKKYLNPYPAEGHTGDLNGTHHKSGQAKAGYVVPDVIISERDGKFEVEVVESKRFFLKVSPMYRTIASDSKIVGSDEDREHVRQYVARARQFISNINQRRETMNKITNYLVETQEEFLRDGVRGLKPLTRSQLANYIGVHESTVSRATAGKFVMLPNRKVIPFSDFFTASLNIKDVIKEIIEVEGKKRDKPLTDQEIVLKLEEQGYRIARRTVAKYRAQLKILPSTLR